MEISLQGKTALVTGSSRGIGREIARGLAERGARVLVHYNAQRAEAEATLASLAGGPHAIARAELGSVETARALVETAESELGGLDILVNNAGVWALHDPVTASLAEWEEAWRLTLATNLLGPAHLSFCAAGAMMARGGGRIVNVSSRGAFRGEPGAPAYGAAKAGLNAMGQSLAQALAPKGVFVFTLAPGFVETAMARGALDGEKGDAIRAQSPLNRVARAEEIANLAIYLAADAPETMTGCIVDINGASYLRT